MHSRSTDRRSITERLWVDEDAEHTYIDGRRLVVKSDRTAYRILRMWGVQPCFAKSLISYSHGYDVEVEEMAL